MMSKEKKSPLLIATFASLLSFVSLLVTLSLPQELSQPQVLGVIAPPRTSNNLVPCSVIESWQKQYCSTTNISPVPTKYVIPTPTTAPTITPTKIPTITPSIKPLPDLIISKAYIAYPPMVAETWNYIGLEIKNIGTAPFFYNTNIKGDITDYAGRTTTCEVGLGTVKPGETQSSSLNCIAYTPGPATITIKVDYNNRITESDENNNVYELNFYVSPKN